MNSYADRYDKVLKDAWFALHDANHLAVAYRLRAIQLTKWRRIRDFINLGMAPSLILLAFVWENPLLRTILVIVSGICSISSWAWEIFGFAFNWDNQIRLSIEIPQKLSLLIPEIDENIKLLYETVSEQEATQLANKLRLLTRQVKGLRGELEREQAHIKPWMNLIAQQDTMQRHDAKCLGCYQKWIPGSKILNQRTAQNLLRKAKSSKLQDSCEECGQKLPARTGTITQP